MELCFAVNDYGWLQLSGDSTCTVQLGDFVRHNSELECNSGRACSVEGAGGTTAQYATAQYAWMSIHVTGTHLIAHVCGTGAAVVELS
jgi:hypothetical protein